MKSPRHPKGRWAKVNTPCGLIRRKSGQDAKREDYASTEPPAYRGPEPLTLWRVVTVSDGAGEVLHTAALYVPTSGRCDQWAGEIDGARSDHLVTATELGRTVAGWVPKRLSVAELCSLG